MYFRLFRRIALHIVVYHLKPGFTIEIFIHFNSRIAVEILNL